MDRPTPSFDPDDRALVEAARRGDERAFRRIVDRYAAAVRRVAMSELRDDVLADETMQETFVRLFRSLDSMVVEVSLFPWLRRVTTNVARDLQRRFKREIRSVPFSSATEARLTAGDRTDDRVLARERADEINRAVSKLRPDRRQAILLRFWKGHTYDEMAEITGVPAGTVASRIHRALHDLGRLLATTSLAPVGRGPTEESDDGT